MVGDYDDPETWRERAKQARERAARLIDPDNRQLMRDVADAYDFLADKAKRFKFWTPEAK